MHKLRDRWSPLSPAGWHDLVTGQLKERQYELALDTLSRMEAQGIEVQNWLYSLTIYNLVDSGEFDEVLKLMQTILGSGNSISSNVWFQVLDVASDALHEECVKFVWERQVVPGFLTPSHGVCSNILIITARTGNVDLAKSVFQVLKSRNSNFILSDYEALLDTYAAAGDVESAFHVLCRIAGSTLMVQRATTRSIVTHLITSDADPKHTWSILKRMKEEERREIPTAAANAIFELSANKRLPEVSIGIYKELHNICILGADTETFNQLFRTCRKSARYDMARFYVQEMVRLKVLPDRTTYETLILLCVDGKLFDVGYKYLTEMANKGFELSSHGKAHVRTHCFESDDHHAKLLQYNAKVRKPISRRLQPSEHQLAIEQYENYEASLENFEPSRNDGPRSFDKKNSHITQDIGSSQD